MGHDIFLFKKGYKERFEDFQNILSNCLKAADIKKEWANCMEFLIEPLGWQAMWNMSRELCADLKIRFPCTVIAAVEEVNFKDLSCLVSITEVEDLNTSLHFPKKMADIPLIELYPTIEQDSSSALSLYETARLIDSLRFFYNYLWMPWDLECDEDDSWVDSHLQGRLKLHFSSVDRLVPHEIRNNIHKLVVEGQRALEEMSTIEEQLLEEMEVDGSSGKLLQLTELRNQLCHLKNQYMIYEKPELLRAVIEKYKTTEEQQSCESVVFLVLSQSTSQQLLKLANLTSDKKLIRLFPTLQEALVKAFESGCVWLVEGKHSIRNLCNLENGGSITGVEPGVILTDETDCTTDIDILRGTLNISSLTINMSSVRNIIKVRLNVECCLSEIKLEGSTVTDGIDVYPGAKLLASNCHFSKCRTAIICDSASNVVLTNCTFTNNTVALQVSEGCNFTMENCTISHTELYGINVLISRPIQGEKDYVNCINSILNMKESGTIYKENTVNVHFSKTTLNHPSMQNGGSDIDSGPR